MTKRKSLGDKPIGVGVIGVGIRGQHSYEVWLAERDDCHVVAVAQQPDPSPALLEGKPLQECARAWARRFRADYLADWRDVPARDDVDLVCVMTDPATAPSVIEHVAALGKPMIRDKYLGADLQGARQVVDVCEQEEVEMLVTYNVRYLPAVARLLAELKEGSLGAPLAATFVYLMGRGPLEGFTATKDYRERVGGGELTCFGVYAVDVALEIFGQLPEKVAASQGTFFYDDYAAAGLEDLAQLTLQFPGGRLAHIITGRTTSNPPPPCYFHLDVLGEGGSLRAHRPEPQHNLYAQGLTILPWASATAVRAMIDDFLLRLRRGGPSPIPARRGYEVLRVIKTAYAAHEAGRALSLEEAPADGT